MDALQFIASLIDSLAWPVAVIVLVFILQAPLRSLLGDLTRFRYGDVEMNFGREIQDLGGRAKAAGLHLPEKPPQSELGVPDFSQIIADATRLSSEFPGPAVGLAWTAVEHELMQVVMRLGISADYPPYNAAIKNIELLYKEGHLDGDTRGLLDRMRRLRNAAVHPSKGMVTISADEAQEFIALVRAMIEKLESLTC